MAALSANVSRETDLPKAGDTIPRVHSMNAVLRQIGWVGGSGRYYPLHEDFTGESRFSAVFVAIGTWVEMEPGHWTIRD